MRTSHVYTANSPASFMRQQEKGVSVMFVLFLLMWSIEILFTGICLQIISFIAVLVFLGSLSQIKQRQRQIRVADSSRLRRTGVCHLTADLRV